MGKKTLKSERDEYANFQATTSRKNYEFLDAKTRRERTFCRLAEFDRHMDKVLAHADAEHAAGRKVLVVLDTERDQVNFDTSLRKRVVDPSGKTLPGDIFYHHRRTLEKAGLSPEEIREREIFQRQNLSKAWRKKKPQQKVRDYYAFQALRANKGLLQSDCHIIQMAVVGDKKGEYAFVLQATRMIEIEFDGIPQLSEKFTRFVTHPAVCSSNNGMFEDIAVIVNSFYGGRLDGINYVEMESLMADRNEGVAYPGALATFHATFPDLTWKKDPRIQMGHWWVHRPTDPQLGYAFTDVGASALVLDETNEDAMCPVDALCYVFPDRPLSNRPNGLCPNIGDFDSGIVLTVSQPPQPAWFLESCQAASANFPNALMPCDNLPSIHPLLRHIYQLWKADETQRIQDLKKGSLDCDWEDVDGPSDPDRFKSTQKGFDDYLGEMLRNMSQVPGVFDSRAALDHFYFDAEARERLEESEGAAAIVDFDEIADGVDDSEAEEVEESKWIRGEVIEEDQLLANDESPVEPFPGPSEAKQEKVPDAIIMIESSDEEDGEESDYVVEIVDDVEQEVVDEDLADMEVVELDVSNPAPGPSSVDVLASMEHQASTFSPIAANADPSSERDVASFLTHPPIDCATNPYPWRVSKLASLLRVGKSSKDKLLQELPKRDAPEHLAAAACSFNLTTHSAEQLLRVVLPILAGRWNVDEKARFLKGLSSSPIMPINTAARLLRYERLDPLLVLFMSPVETRNIVEDKMDVAGLCITFYGRIYNMPMDEKMQLARCQAFYDEQQYSHYSQVLQPKHLLKVVSDVCALYGWPYPSSMLRERIPALLTTVAGDVTRGATSVDMAIKRVSLLGENESLRPDIIRALSARTLGTQILRNYFAREWTNVAPPVVLDAPQIQCDLSDRFHQFVDDNQPIRTKDEMKVAIDNVLGPASKVMISWHYLNDLRCPDQIISLMSFRAALTASSYHFFVLGPDALPSEAVQDFLHAISSKEVFASAEKPFRSFTKLYVDAPFRRFRCLSKHARHDNGTFLDRSSELVLQQKHCCAFFRDYLTRFEDCSPLFLMHISASLFILEFFPWDEPAN